MTPWTGTARLVRLAIRRDRYTLPAWIISLGVFVGATTAMFNSSLATPQDLFRETSLVANNTGMRMIGLVSGPTVGGYLLHREYVSLAVLAALMSALAVARHTRQNEELGRSEMLGATVVGRYAALAAAVIVTVLANLALAVVIGVAMSTSGQPVWSSFLAGASVGAVGLVFTGVAAVACQLSSSSRGALGITGGVLAVSFLLSGVGNMLGTVDPRTLRISSTWLVWLSPIGWGEQARPFAEDAWWPLLLALPLLGALLVLAVSLVSRRDVGRGLWAERRGQARAGRPLLSPLGLTLRMQRGVLVGWGVALLGFGLILGSLAKQITESPSAAADYYSQMGRSDVLIDAYRGSMAQIAGMFVAIYVVQVLLRMRSEEASGTLESVLATGVTRTRWIIGHLVTALLGATLLATGFCLFLAVGAGLAMGDLGSQISDMAPAGVAQLPSILVMGAVVLVVVAVLPRWAVPISWSLLIVSFVLGPMFGPAFALPAWLANISPFTHAPLVPAVDLTAGSLIGLLAVSAALATAGLLAIRRRDLVLPA